MGACGWLAGCATALHGTTQTVEITSSPPGATATVLPQNTVVTTPATINLARKSVYTVLYNLEGYSPASVYIDKLYSDATYGNLVIGGAIGTATDLESGAAWNLDPDPAHAVLVPLPLATTTPAQPSNRP